MDLVGYNSFLMVENILVKRHSEIVCKSQELASKNLDKPVLYLLVVQLIYQGIVIYTMCVQGN